MLCQYCDVGAYTDFCYCKKSSDKAICPYVRRCPKIMNWVELESMKNCSVLNSNDGNVKFCRHGYLYVELDGYIIKIKNPYNDYVPNIVKLRKYKGNWTVIKEKNNE